MTKTKKKIKVRDLKPKKNPRAGRQANPIASSSSSEQGNKFVQGTGRHSLN